MRRILFSVTTCIMSLFFIQNVNATHIMGGEITWECIKDPASPDVGKYIFTMKLYRDCDGTTLPVTAQNIEVWEDGVNIQNISCPFLLSTDISPNCNVANSGNAQLDCYGTNPAGAVEEYIYQSAPVSLNQGATPGVPPASGWYFTWSSCCRNGAITNLQLSSTTNPSEGFTLRAVMYPYTDPATGLVVPADPCFDSSPLFNESPKTIICAGYPFAYSHNASDPEIDSIRYYWAEPLDDFFGAFDPNPTNNNPGAIPFVAPYAANSPLPGTPTLNPVSGEISYSTNQAGFYVTVTEVRAYKCGQLISKIFRDIQAVLIACPMMSGVPNDPPTVPTPTGSQTWTVSAGSSILDAYETTVTAGEFVTFNILGIDSNLYNGVIPQDLTMEVSGGQILDPVTGTCANPPCATFLSLSGSPPPIVSPIVVEGVFAWQTTCDHVSSDVACGRTTNLYQFSIKVYDDFCPAPAIRNVTLMVYVEADNQMQISEIQPSCFGNDGVITLEPSLSITQVAWDAYLYDLFGNTVDSVLNISGNLGSLNNLSPGDYIVRAQGAGGCLVQDSITLLLAPNPLVMETNVSHVNCYGGSDGEIGVFLDNGLLPYSFYIDGIQNTNPPPYDSLFTGLSEGTYVITAIDSDSCGLRDTVYIDVPQFPLQILSNNSVVICDASLGSDFVYGYAAGGTPFSDGSYNFNWYDLNWGIIGSEDSISNLGIGDYFLEVTDSNNCQTNIPITVSTQQSPLDLSLALEGVVCTGDATGWATAHGVNGLPPYSYEWSDPSGTVLQTTNSIITHDTLSNLVADTNYRLLITDAYGCTQEAFFIIDEEPIRLEISSVEVVDSIDCYGDLNGRAIVNMVSGSGSIPYSYYWDNGETAQEAVGLSGGWHTVWVSDTRGCIAEDSVYIPENSEIISTLSINNPISCFGDNDGVISVSTQGGVPLLSAPYYEYFWSTAVSTNTTTISSLSHGGYVVVTRDALGCVVEDSIYLSEPDPLYVNAEEILRASCYGFGDASAYAVGVGGTLPYQFFWALNGVVDFSQNDSSIVNTLYAGLETVVLTDVRGCQASDTVMINHPDELIVTISDSTLAYCTGINTASATALVAGGTLPYTYEWNDNVVVPQTTMTASNLDAGVYMVSVEDSRGCVDSVSVNLTYIPDTMATSISVVSHVSCYNGNDGALAAQVNPSGIPPYTYQWVGPTGLANSSVVTNLPAGIYSVTVTDVNGCVVTTNQQLSEPSPLDYEVVSTTSNPSCLGACDGSVFLNVQGGMTPYTAHFSNNQTGINSAYSVVGSSLVDGVCTGDYTVTVADANGCDATLILGGSNQSSLNTSVTTVVSTSSTDVLCYGAATGELTVVNPLASPYSYMWLDLNGDTIGSTSSINTLLAGDYILYSSYSGINGCTTVDTLTILENSLIQPNEIKTDVSCSGGSDGKIVLSTGGGVPPYTYVWNNGSSSSIISNLAAGAYSVSITDAAGCVITESYYIQEPNLLVATVSVSQTYILNASQTGGTPPFSYQWYSGGIIPGATLNDYIVSANGTYYVEITDANNCTSESNTILFNETSLTNFDGSIDLSVYPNPFREETTIDFGQIISDATITIVDVYGKLIEKHELKNTDKYIVKGTDKASGVYFMEIEINQINIKSKIIIK